MASGLVPTLGRRASPRLGPEEIGYRREALLRPGQHVFVVNVGARGALLESAARIKPGARAELQLFGQSRRHLRGRILRSRVCRLAPLCYEAAIAFDEILDLAGDLVVVG